MLECLVKAYPKPNLLWTRGGKTPKASRRYRAVTNPGEGPSEIRSILGIANIQQEDFGEYTCYAANAEGENEKTVILYGKIQ